MSAAQDDLESQRDEAHRSTAAAAAASEGAHAEADMLRAQLATAVHDALQAGQRAEAERGMLEDRLAAVQNAATSAAKQVFNLLSCPFACGPGS